MDTPSCSEPLSLVLCVRKDECPKCTQLEKEKFFDNLQNLSLGPRGKINTFRAGGMSLYCPIISCILLKDYPEATGDKFSTFNHTYDPVTKCARPCSNPKKMSIKNIQDFCDAFISQQEKQMPSKIPAAMPGQARVSEVDFFSLLLFPIKDNRKHGARKIFPELLPKSVITVRQMVNSLGLSDKITPVITLIDRNFWRSKEDCSRGDCGPPGCAGRPGICPCQKCTPKPHRPVQDQKNIILGITASLASEIDLSEFGSRKFSVTKGPRDNILVPVSCVSTCITNQKAQKYAAVPNREALECLEILKRRDPYACVGKFCYADNFEYAIGAGRFDKRFTDMVKVDDAEDLPNALETFIEYTKIETTTYTVKFEMMVLDLEQNLKLIQEFLTVLSQAKFVN